MGWPAMAWMGQKTFLFLLDAVLARGGRKERKPGVSG